MLRGAAPLPSFFMATSQSKQSLSQTSTSQITSAPSASRAHKRSLLDDAYERTVHRLTEDMPLLLHGSGDVVPSQVVPETAQLVAALTTDYITHLVDAALDSQQMLCDGAESHIAITTKRKVNHMKRNGKGSAAFALARRAREEDPITMIPPPRFVRSRKPPVPPPPETEETTDDTPKKASGTGAKRGVGRAAEIEKMNKRRKQQAYRSSDDFWDEPLKEPKIRNKTASSSTGLASDKTGFPSSSTINTPVHIDEWVGVAGVDLLETRRTREAYVHGPQSGALQTQSFIFPICHDVYAYGRVLEVQAARRSIQPLLLDPVVMEVVRTDGPKLTMKRKKKSKKPKNSGRNEDDGDDEDNEEEDEDGEAEEDTEQEGGPMWPGLDGILPSYNSTFSTGAK